MKMDFPISNPKINFPILVFFVFLVHSHTSEAKQTDNISAVRRLDRNYNKSNGNSSTSAFVQIPHSNPPTVRPPPYSISKQKCPDMNTRENWRDTLCGDLNTGFVPQNPFGQKFPAGGTYPFDTIKNKTLEFFRRALPILKKNKSLPKVARYSTNPYPETIRTRVKRSPSPGIATREAAYPSLQEDSHFIDDSFYHNNPIPSPSRRRRQYGPGPSQSNPNRFCENTMNYYNRLCKIYNAMWGKAPHNVQRETSIENRYYHPGSTKPQHHHNSVRPTIDVAVIEPSNKSPKNLQTSPSNSNYVQSSTMAELPPTPCPSSAEYMTPVFARNHEGAWRYVVQIPKEGYFTQTVEVTKCLKSTCFYMDGSCKTSPRWQSLLVAELYYPDNANFHSNANPTSPSPQFHHRSSNNEIESYSKKPATDHSQCDGYDSLGCYQVRLFYDWFLIPGSCKCWKVNFDFTQRGQQQSEG